jgi:biotin-(acetyl-CoA carboxylase) ligase
MPTELRSRIHTPYTGRLDLPPGFREVPLREAGDAFGHAEKIAAKEGAGTLVWVRRFDVVEFAVVLEPEEPLAGARRTFYVAQCALFDALASHAPPDKNIRFVWPDAVLVDGGLVAGSQIGWPSRAEEKKPPRWIVFAAMVRSAIMGGNEPGALPNAASLEEEGFDELGSGRLVETFARHLLVWTDVWQQEGYRPVFEHYLERLDADEPLERSIDGFGNLLIRRKGKLDTSKKELLPALAKRDWYDEESRGLKL